MSVCSELSGRSALLMVAATALVLMNGVAGLDGLGVNWGDISSHPLPPKSVVKMLKANGIKKVKLFNSPEHILNALAGTGIEVMIGTPNALLKEMVNYDVAEAFVKENVTRYKPTSPDGVKITLVGIGNEPFLKFYKKLGLFDVTYPALANMQKALNEAGIGKTTKATVPFNADVYLSPPDKPVPSAGMFRPDIQKQVKQIIKVLDENDSPFMINVYPFLSLYFANGSFPFDFAFFDGVDKPLDDNGKTYTNVFDANYDTAVAALAREGHGKMTVTVGEIGWPTDGNEFANASLAAKFYGGFIKHLASKKGTPARPGSALEVYMFGLFDEDQKSVLPGDFERHWGILGYDGQPKFKLDLSGGKGKALTGVPEIEYLPKKWCTVKSNAKFTNMKATISYACDRADCTATSNGSSCHSLTEPEKLSYYFNAYFQTHEQEAGSCDFGGLGEVTTTNLSTSTCNFNIGIKVPPPEAPSPGSPADGSPSKPGSNSSSRSLSGSGLLLCRGIFLLLPLFFLIRIDSFDLLF
ncbi:PREDICTED: glucan endo-1,3-beta-glucosidase 8-like [Ipomoea nil]|uniref:glucan endo-1,3-beta-glucosidase 8-like n=1 Tax=Ipomoea nil TaxID=35883 RepID=UPI0009011D07|nr:PREDICTED: glucan endo-1,3-beta-glucosidase 8-like [Ipomoea nil]